MRLATVAIAAMLLTVVAPALAHDQGTAHGPCDENDDEPLHRVSEYACSIEIEEDIYVQAGWWGAHGYSLDGVDDAAADPANAADHLDAREDQRPVWLHLRSTDSDAPVEVTVTSKGAVIAGLDAWKYRDDEGDHPITPPCPQGMVDEVLPEDPTDNLGRTLTHVLHATTDRHQRAVSLPFPDVRSDQTIEGTESTMQVQLDPTQSSGGYIIAIYPQASAGIAQQEGNPSIDYTLSSVDGSRMTIIDDLEHEQPELPFQATGWVFPESNALACLDDLVQPPADQLGADVPELETLPGTAPTADELLGTDLEG